MKDNKTKTSPFQKSVWDIELNPVNTPSPITVEQFSQKTTSELIEKNRFSQCATCLSCSSWQKTLAIIVGLCIIVTIGVLVPLFVTNVFGLSGKNPSTTTSATSTISTTTITTETSTSTTSTTTTTRAVCSSGCANITTSLYSRIAFYSFDLNTNDATGVYSASGIPSPTYVTGYVSAAISFDASLSQRLTAPAMRLNSRSFTIEFWFSLSSSASSTNYAFFGQLSVQSTTKQTLFLASASANLDFGFFNDDTFSPTTLSANTWYHAAFVYDNDKGQRFIYINRVLNIASGVGVGPYLGTSGPINIGGATIYGSLGIPYLSGVMDHLSVYTRAKTACEILNDATLAVYLPFDGNLVDAGPNFLTAISSGVSFVNGFVNEAVNFSGLNSYIQISSLTGLGQTNYPFSIAFWVYPITTGVLVHVHALPSGIGWCIPFLGISITGRIISQVYSSASPYVMIGPVLQFNTWTHIVETYSPTNGGNLYVNGMLYTSNPSATIYTASGSQNYITIGNLLSGSSCYNPGIVQTPFQGLMDEFHVYSRELSLTDVCILAWP